MANSITENIDWMEAMAKVPDGWFDLAVVDPPWGINVNDMGLGRRKGRPRRRDGKAWDSQVPDVRYFNELFRVSKSQIIWGGNNFRLPPSRSWIFWDKNFNDGLSFSDGELAWVSFGTTIRKVRVKYAGVHGADPDGRIHPTQKPVALYDWIFKKYAKPGMKILDTHLGSGSSRISAHKAGLDFWGYELDKDYFEAQEKRFEQYMAQLKLFG